MSMVGRGNSNITATANSYHYATSGSSRSSSTGVGSLAPHPSLAMKLKAYPKCCGSHVPELSIGISNPENPSEVKFTLHRNHENIGDPESMSCCCCCGPGYPVEYPLTEKLYVGDSVTPDPIASYGHNKAHCCSTHHTYRLVISDSEGTGVYTRSTGCCHEMKIMNPQGQTEYVPTSRFCSLGYGMIGCGVMLISAGYMILPVFVFGSLLIGMVFHRCNGKCREWTDRVYFFPPHYQQGCCPSGIPVETLGYMEVGEREAGGGGIGCGLGLTRERGIGPVQPVVQYSFHENRHDLTYTAIRLNSDALYSYPIVLLYYLTFLSSCCNNCYCCLFVGFCFHVTLLCISCTGHVHVCSVVLCCVVSCFVLLQPIPTGCCSCDGSIPVHVQFPPEASPDTKARILGTAYNIFYIPRDTGGAA